jgi:hypothetical protein
MFVSAARHHRDHEEGSFYSSRMEHPPPVPVTHPRDQNFAQSDGMRLAGWSGFSEWTSAWLLVESMASDVIVDLKLMAGGSRLKGGGLLVKAHGLVQPESTMDARK